MAIRLSGSGGDVTDAAVVSLYASGVITPGNPVDFLPNGTGGGVVGPSESTSTSTMVFGLGLDYVQGASDTRTRVIPFDSSQLWEVDCANAATTAQLGIRHALSASRGYVHNTATDIGVNVAVATRALAVFLALSMTGSTSGSGKLIGKFVVTGGVPVIGASGQI